MQEQLAILPQDIPAEQSVLGSIFINPDKLTALADVLVAEDFFKPAHRIIYATMLTLNARGEAIDAVTMRTALEAQGELTKVGGIPYLAEIVGIVPTSANLDHYAKIVMAKAEARRAIAELTNRLAEIYEGTEPLSDILARAEDAMAKAGQRSQVTGFQNIYDVLNRTHDRIEERANQTGDITGLSSGFKGLDKLINGLNEDSLIILAARPAMGKTALALNIAQHVATVEKRPVAIFSLEMGAESLVERLLSAGGLVPAQGIRTGQMTEEQWLRLFKAESDLSTAPIHIDETAGIKVSDIRAKARKLAHEAGGLGLIVIDYLQLITGKRSENRQQQVSEISRQLKILAKELKVPVLALSQLSRGVEQRQEKRPVMSDLRESGSIEQDADVVAFLYRESYYNREKTGQADDGVTELIVDKNRHGELGTVNLHFHKQFTKFSMAEVD